MSEAATLLARLHRGGGYGLYWTKTGDTKLTHWHPVGNNGHTPTGWAAIYFGVHPTGQAGSKSQRSTNETVCAVNCVYADFDAKDFGGDKAASLARIRTLPLQPSVIVDSGGGYHCYWLLRETCQLNDGNREAAKKIQAAWVEAVGADASAKDLARVLRMPGTLNHKYNPPRLVSVVEANYEREYTLDTLAAYAAQHQSVIVPARKEPVEPRQMAHDKGAGAMIVNAIETVRSAPEGTRNHALYGKAYALAGLVAAGRANASVFDQLADAAEQSGLSRREVEATILSARKTGESRPLESRPAANAENERDPAATASKPNCDKTLRTANRTDSGNADCIAAIHGDDMRYVHDLKSWAIWDGTRWAPDRDGEAQRRARDVARQRYHAAADIEDETSRIALAKWATQSEQAGRTESALKMAMVHESFTSTIDRFDTDALRAATPGETLDLSHGRAYPPQRNDHIMKRLGAKFDPGATCPRWLQFLSEVFASDAALIGFIRRAVGYSLTGDTREQKLFMCIGSGANGKSTFLEILAALAGEYHATAAFSTFDASEQNSREAAITLAALRGVRLVTVIESDEDRRLAEARVKSVTGQDSITARANYGNPFTYRPQFKIWLAMNHKPVITGTDHGIWRRIALIPFTQRFEGKTKDQALAAKLRAELPGILNWALAGAATWLKDGLQEPQAVTDAVAEYRAESDVIGRWLEECTEHGAHMTMKAADAYKSYRAWCETNGGRAMSNTAFGRNLTERDIKKEKTMRGAIYVGYGLLSTNP